MILTRLYRPGFSYCKLYINQKFFGTRFNLNFEFNRDLLCVALHVDYKNRITAYVIQRVKNLIQKF